MTSKFVFNYGLTIIQYVLARGIPIWQKLENLGKKSLLPKKISFMFLSKNMQKKSLEIVLR